MFTMTILMCKCLACVFTMSQATDVNFHQNTQQLGAVEPAGTPTR